MTMTDRTGKKTDNNLWLYVYPILFGLAYSQAPLFTENQNTKFISGLALAGYRDVAADWMARITDPFPLFSHLLKWQYQLLGLYAGVHLSFLLVLALYGASGVLLAKTLFTDVEENRRPILMFSLIWLIVHTIGIRNACVGIFPEGLASQYLIRNYYQPCCLGVLLFIGIFAYTSGRSLLAALCFVLAPLFHPTYLISSLLIATAITLLPANRSLGISSGKRLLFISIVVIALSICAVWNMNMLSSGDPLIREKAHQILAEVRIPHHALPSDWSLIKTIMFFSTGFAAAWSGRKWFLGQLLLVMLMVVAATVLWAIIDYNTTFAVLAPWRVSVFLAPLSWIILLTTLAKFLTQTSRWKALFASGRLRRGIIIFGIAGSLAGVASTVFRYQHKTKDDYYPISRFLEGYHKSGNQYLVPLDQMSIRLEAGVPVYATWKSHPTKDSEFLEWYKRTEIASSIYDKPQNQAQSQLLALIESRSVTHVVWPAAKGVFPYSRMGQQVYKDRHFSLWDLSLAARK
jgi:hypothetical protein